MNGDCKWKIFYPNETENLSEDTNYLVSYYSLEEKKWMHPHAAWWDEIEKRFYPLESLGSFPLHVEAYMPMPMPKFQV